MAFVYQGDQELESKAKKAAERISENMHIVANEPSLALYRLQEHVRKALPPMVERRVEVTKLQHELQGRCYDVEYALSAVKSMDGAATSFKNIQEMLKQSIFLKQQLKYEETRRNKKDTNSVYKRLCCPQGGVLSPLLWNLVANDLITKLNVQRFFTVGYADDLAILISGHFASVACNLMRNALKVVETWCTEYGLTVNPKKTQLVMFTNKRNLGTYQLPYLSGTKLELSDEVKYLGITLDNKLKWATHLENKIKKATISFWQCRKMIGKTWGLSPKITLWLYNTVIRPSITYGAIVWWPRTSQITTINKLQKFQRLACVATTGCMRTAPTAAVEALIGLTPLHLHVQQEAAAAAFRLWALNLWSQDKLAQHTNIIDEFSRDNPLLLSVYDRIPKTHIHTKSYMTQLHEEPSDISDTHELRIYTDGSKMSIGSGAGAFSEDLNIHISAALGAHNSIFQAECVGIIQAASAVLRRQVTGQNIRILSDSAAVLQALNRYEHNSGLTLQCHQLLEEVCKSNNITLQWIKGHSGSRGNDEADGLARRGSEMQTAGPEPLLPIPFGQVRSWIRNRTATLHQEYWASTQGCRQSKEALPVLNPRYSRRLLSLKRDKLRLIVGIVTGHCSLNKHLFNLGVTDSPLCRGCMRTEETAAHVLLECSSVATQRAHYLGTPGTPGEACASISQLLAFLEDIGWLA